MQPRVLLWGGSPSPPAHPLRAGLAWGVQGWGPAEGSPWRGARDKCGDGTRGSLGCVLGWPVVACGPW